jgi:hypothetical protein
VGEEVYSKMREVDLSKLNRKELLDELEDAQNKMNSVAVRMITERLAKNEEEENESEN